MPRDLETLAREIAAFAAARQWERFHSPKNLAMALSVEAAEVLELFQWLTQAESRNLTEAQRERVREEVGDVLIYLVRLADQCGIDPLDAAFRKLEKNAEKYPVETSKGHAGKPSQH